MFFRRRHYNELAQSIREHLDEEIDTLMAEGLSREEATRRARQVFGNVTLIEEESREVWQWPRIESIFRDARFALRQLTRNPGFTATVVLTLALAIGANTAIFSVVNALLLKSLPYANPERLATLYLRTSSGSSGEPRNIDGEQWDLLRDNVPSLFSAISGLRSTGVNLRAGTHVQYLRVGRISAQYLNVLGISPLIGRNFSDAEDRPHGPRVAILSYALWRAAFDADPGILGRAVLLKGEPYTVVGVLPDRATTPLNSAIYTPLQPTRDGEGVATNYFPIVRLRDGASWEQAGAEMNRAWANSRRVQMYTNDHRGGAIAYYAVPLQKGQTDSLRAQVLALMLAAAFILLIACANLAGLTLVRMLRRTAEMATRISLGASRWQLQRQLWIENLLLALAGGVAAILVGMVALRAILMLLPQRFLPVAAVSLDARVLAFTFSLAVFTSILFGMLPALAVRQDDLRASIANRGAIGMRLRQGMIAGEVALTVVLLAAAGLLIRTLIHLETLPPGFDPYGVMAAKASLDDVRYRDPAAFRNLLRDSIAAMRQIPGVRSAAVGLALPFERALFDGITLASGPEAGRNVTTNWIYVTPGYFDTLRIPVLSGRTFTDADGPGSQPVVIVNRTFARKFLHDANPVGHYLDKNTLIVGVTGDAALSSAGGLNPGSAPLTSEETIYRPAAQMNDGRALGILHAWFQPSWIVRTAAPVEGLTGLMQHALADVDPQLPFSGFYSMNDLMASSLAMQRVEVALLGALSVLALVLSAVGIFALVANIVAHRTREIGIRLALGSSIHEAMIHIGRTGVRASAAGLLVGLLLCSVVLRAMRSVIYGISVYDVTTIAAVVLTLAAVTLFATVVPTLRVARIDPAKTLREE